MDHRIRAGRTPAWYQELDERGMTALVEVYDEETDSSEVETVPFQFAVCPTCRGKGRHVNPNIDAHGITSDERDRYWSPEEWDSYQNGGFDVTCFGCGGRRVVPVIDRQRADPAVVRRIDAAAREEAEYLRQCAMEARFGC